MRAVMKQNKRSQTTRHRPLQLLKWEKKKWKSRVSVPRIKSLKRLSSSVINATRASRSINQTSQTASTLSAQSSFVDSGLSSVQTENDETYPQRRLQAPTTLYNSIDTHEEAEQHMLYIPRQAVGFQQEDDRISGMYMASPPYPIPTDVHINNDGIYHVHPNAGSVMDIDIAAENSYRASLRLCVQQFKRCATCFQNPRLTVNIPCMCVCNCLECRNVMVICAMCQTEIEASAEITLFI